MKLDLRSDGYVGRWLEENCVQNYDLVLQHHELRITGHA
jgi:hypothetical protein